MGICQGNILVKNHGNLADLKESITVAFLELTNEMISFSVNNTDKRLELVVERRGTHVEKKVSVAKNMFLFKIMEYCGNVETKIKKNRP